MVKFISCTGEKGITLKMMMRNISDDLTSAITPQIASHGKKIFHHDFADNMFDSKLQSS